MRASTGIVGAVVAAVLVARSRQRHAWTPDAATRTAMPATPPPAPAPPATAAPPPPAPWLPLPLADGWEDYSDVYGEAGYQRGHDGSVRLRGLVTKAAGGLAPPDVIATLPEDCRPSSRLVFATVCGAGRSWGSVDVDPNGDVIYTGAGAAAEKNYTSLSPVTFDAADAG